MAEIGTIKAKFRSICKVCHDVIEEGETCQYSKGFGVYHGNCAEGTSKDETKLIIVDEEDKRLLGLK